MDKWIINKSTSAMSRLLFGLLLATIIGVAIPATAISQECTRTAAELESLLLSACGTHPYLPCGCDIYYHSNNNIRLFTFAQGGDGACSSSIKTQLANGCYSATCSDPTNLCCQSNSKCCDSDDDCCGKPDYCPKKEGGH